MKRKYSSVVAMTLCFVALLVTFAGCAPVRIAMPVQRKPNLDTSGIKRIAVMPFDGGRTYHNIAVYATSQAMTNIQATNHFIMISPTTIEDARRRGESLENYVDALFTGQIIRIATNQPEPVTTSWTDKKGTVHTTTTYETTVEVELTYQFTRTRDGSMIGPKKVTTSLRETSNEAHPSASTLTNKVIDNIFRGIRTDVAPYTTTVSRTLQKDKLNKEVQKQMDELEKQVSAGNYVFTKRAYTDLWKTYNSVPAAINASYLMEATGETREAVNFMLEVFTATGNPLVNTRLSELDRELAEQAQLEEFRADKGNPIPKVTEYAVSEVAKVLPTAPRIWLYNVATTNQNMVNDIVDNMTSTYIRSGITIVERQMIDKIISEQDFQLSGNVNDTDIVRIGGMAGVTTVVVVSASGVGSNRRLNVRVLDIASGTVKMQSSTSSEWNF